ncbi:hypothetical protein [Actinoplanes sp. NPDC051411]|uniref:hypothetical protein n=1 Tax=Actinoplanes sp. NPDC051411 TaxID=3155522 RepID=UPI0034374119
MRERDGRPNAGPARPVLHLAEADYRFGSGTLHLAVTHVRWSAPQNEAGELWYEVDGIEIADDGRTVGPRSTLVRGSRLRTLMNTGRHMGS